MDFAGHFSSRLAMFPQLKRSKNKKYFKVGTKIQILKQTFAWLHTLLTQQIF